MKRSSPGPGVAGSTEKGLMVPVVRHCDALGMAEIERAIGDAPKRAREGKITLADLEGVGARSGVDASPEAVIRAASPAGELKIVPEPEGTRGYDDLRRAATREPLGRGLRPSVVSTGDLLIANTDLEAKQLINMYDAEPGRVAAMSDYVRV